ncbi:MAG: HXXEE domain-containing protein [Clostridia bacterium]|nr:HXXEE domain-containing protein [Clostridia bacterium]
MEAIIFMFCLTLHNIEEALWLTDWQKQNMPNSRRTLQKEHFIFAVLGITVLGYLAAGLFALFPDHVTLAYAFYGFVGAMLINAIVPHLLFTILYRKYYPGVLTGCFLIMPFHIILLLRAASEKGSVVEIMIATLAVGLILLGSIPVFERIAKKIFDARLSEWAK